MNISLNYTTTTSLSGTLFSSFVTVKLDSYDLAVLKFGHSLIEQFHLEWMIVVKHELLLVLGLPHMLQSFVALCLDNDSAQWSRWS